MYISVSSPGIILPFSSTPLCTTFGSCDSYGYENNSTITGPSMLKAEDNWGSISLLFLIAM